MRIGTTHKIVLLIPGTQPVKVMKNILPILALAFFCFSALSGCKVVVNTFAFHPDTRRLPAREQLPAGVQELFIEADDQVKIQSYFISNEKSDKILVYFHGNAGNICSRLPDLLQLHDFGLNVLGVSYRGYGKSHGKPSEEGIYLDGKAALNFATRDLGFPLHKVIIFGRSIGTAVAVNTAQDVNIYGLVLVTPLTSGRAHAEAGGLSLFSFLAGNSFNNISKISNIKCPLLIIHGTKDRVIPIEMGEEIYKKASMKKQFVKVEGAGHNNLSTLYKNKYWPPVRQWVSERR